LFVFKIIYLRHIYSLFVINNKSEFIIVFELLTLSSFSFCTTVQHQLSFRSHFYTRAELVIHVARRPNLLWRSYDVNDFL